MHKSRGLNAAHKMKNHVVRQRRGMLDYFEGALNSDLTSVKLGSMPWCGGLLPEIVNILAGSSLSVA